MSQRSIYIFSYKPTHFYFHDYIQSIIHYIPDTKLILYTKDNYCYNYIKNNNILNSIIIFIQFFIRINIQPNTYFLLNTEQLSVKRWYDALINVYNKNINIIDFSIENIKILGTGFHLPYLYNPDENFYDSSTIKPYDVAFISTKTGFIKSKRRQHIINNLSAKPWVKVRFISGFKNIRDKELAKCKLLINIHFDSNYKILETLRCYRCIYNKMIVISEDCVINDSYYLNKYIIFEKYENIIEKVLEVLQNYEKYNETVFAGFDISEIEDKCIKISMNLQNI